MKRWLLLTFAFAFIGLPGTLLLVNTLEVSNQVHVTALVGDPNEPVNSPTVITTSGGGGGSDNGTIAVNIPTTVDQPNEDTSSTEQELQTVIYFGGYAFPNAEVTFTLDVDFSFTVSANDEGYFEGSYDELYMGEHIFTFQALSYEGEESRLVSYAYNVQNEAALYISSVLLPPIFGSNQGGDGLSGVAIPGSEIQVFGVSQGSQALVGLETIQVGSDGTYAYEVDLKEGAYSQYYVSCSYEGQGCGYSGIVPIQVIGDTYEIPSNIFADFTQDVEVNFIDFSFMRSAFLSSQSILFYDLDEDGDLTLKDFSLLDYQWTR